MAGNSSQSRPDGEGKELATSAPASDSLSTGAIPEIAPLDALLDRFEDTLMGYWLHIVNSQHEPAHLATWVKCIFLEGYQAARGDQK